MATEAERLAARLYQLATAGSYLHGAQYSSDSKKEMTRRLPSDEDYRLSLSADPLPKDVADNLISWPNILRRCEGSLFHWWASWDLAKSALEKLPEASTATLSAAFRPFWKIKLRKLLNDLGAAIEHTREPDGSTYLWGFISRHNVLPDNWSELHDEVARFADELAAIHDKCEPVAPLVETPPVADDTPRDKEEACYTKETLPAAYRERGKAKGMPLVLPYLEETADWSLDSPTLQTAKRNNVPSVKVRIDGKAKNAYEYKALATFRRSRDLKNADAENEGH